MRRTLASLLAVPFLLSVMSVAQQMSMMKPPNVLEIIREQVKTGKGAMHDKHEAAWLHAMKANKYNDFTLAVSSVTGDNEEWFFVGFDSFAGYEKGAKGMMENAALRNIMESYGEKDADYIDKTSTVLAKYRPELSYKPEFNLGEFRYFTIGVLHLKVGADAADLYKTLNMAREKSGVETHNVVFQVMSGMPAGTYLSFVPLKDLSAWDAPPNEKMDAAMKEAKWSEVVSANVAGFYPRLFAFNPMLSNVPENVAKASPEFWHPKAEMAAKKSGEAAKAGETAKPMTPAAKKTPATTKK